MRCLVVLFVALMSLPMLCHPFPVTLGWDYPLGSIPVDMLREYLLESSPVPTGPWGTPQRFPARRNATLVLDTTIDTLTLPRCFRLAMRGEDTTHTPPALLASLPSNVVCADAPMLDVALPTPILRIAEQKGALTRLAWTVPDAVVSTPLATAIPATHLRIRAVDSEEHVGYPASAAIDGDPATFWHTAWRAGTPPPHPHTLTLDLGAVYAVNGWQALPRQDGHAHGRLDAYTLALSLDGTAWTAPMAGRVPTTAPLGWHTMRFPAAKARYMQLVVTASAGGDPYTSLAELHALHERPAIPRKNWQQLVIESACPACGGWSALRRAPALAAGVFVTTIPMTIEPPRCFRLRITARDTTLVPPALVSSAPSNAVCAD